MNSNERNEELEIIEDMKQTCSLLFIALNKIQAEADSKLEGLTFRQLLLLLTVAHLESEEATVNNIALRLGTSKQNVTRLVGHLANLGYLVSTPSQTDKRSVNISLTPEGTALLKKNIGMSGQYFLELFHNFSKEEIKSLRSSLTKLADYDQSNQPHLETKVVSDVGPSKKELDSFLEQIAKHYLSN